MIELGNPQIKYHDGQAILENDIVINGKKQIIWFKVDEEYGKYLCDERNDAYLIACLNYAMRNNHDIVSRAPITEDLLYNIETYLIPALIENNPSFHRVKISAEVSSDVLPSGGAVGTGISCGVDSLNALANHTDSKFHNYNITHLTFNNVGSLGEGDRARKLYLSRIERSREFAKKYGFKFVAGDSNLMDIIEQSHFKTHTYSSMFPVYCLQKLYSCYLYASGGYRFNEFELRDLPNLCCGSYELLSLNVFSTPQIQIKSEGMGITRLNKLRNVIKYEPSHRYLNVCLQEGDNCGVCEKCVRTLLGLDSLNSLDLYKEVFDINYYRDNKKWYLQQMMYRIKDKKHDYLEMYPFFKNEISPIMRLKAEVYVLKVALFKFIRANTFLYNVAKRVKGKNA